MNATTQTSSAIDEEIAEAMQDALNDGDGRPRQDALKHHLAKHGLVIVEAREHARMLFALQLIGSCVKEIQGIPTALDAMAQAARNAIPTGA